MATTTSTTTTKTTTPATVKTTTTAPVSSAVKAVVTAPAPAVSKPMYFNEITKSWTYGTAPAAAPAPVIAPAIKGGGGGGGGVVTVAPPVITPIGPLVTPTPTPAPTGTSAVDAAIKQLQQPGVNVIQWERDVLNPALKAAGPGAYVTSRGVYTVSDTGAVKWASTIGGGTAPTVKVTPDVVKELQDVSGKKIAGNYLADLVRTEGQKAHTELTASNPLQPLTNLELQKVEGNIQFQPTFGDRFTALPVGFKAENVPVYSDTGLIGSYSQIRGPTGKVVEKTFKPIEILAAPTQTLVSTAPSTTVSTTTTTTTTGTVPKGIPAI